MKLGLEPTVRKPKASVFHVAGTVSAEAYDEHEWSVLQHLKTHTSTFTPGKYLL